MKKVLLVLSFLLFAEAQSEQSHYSSVLMEEEGMRILVEFIAESKGPQQVRVHTDNIYAPRIGDLLEKLGEMDNVQIELFEVVDMDKFKTPDVTTRGIDIDDDRLH